MKKILVILVLSIFTMSCSSEDDNENISTDPILIKKIAYSNATASDPTIVEYTYDDTKLVSAVIDNSTTLSYIYEGDLVTRINSYSSNNVLTNYFVFTYENNLLKSSRHIIPVADQGFRTEYTHNNDNTISVAQFSGSVSSQNDSEPAGKYFMSEDGEISKFEQYNLLGTTTTTYLYDTKNNPFKNVTGFDKLLNLTGKYHNVTSVESTDQNGASQGIETHTYIYDQNSFPQSAVRNQNGQETIIVYYYE